MKIQSNSPPKSEVEIAEIAAFAASFMSVETSDAPSQTSRQNRHESPSSETCSYEENGKRGQLSIEGGEHVENPGNFRRNRRNRRLFKSVKQMTPLKIGAEITPNPPPSSISVHIEIAGKRGERKRRKKKKKKKKKKE